VVVLVRGNLMLDTLVVQVVVVPRLLVIVILVVQEIDKYQTVAIPFQIKDILVELDMVFLQITLDLAAAAAVPVVLEKMEAQIQQQVLTMVVDMVVQEKQV
tara:strand:- start:1016 stop:1318 length:303 start_codon:yes stop_codon:yes gene_type:complete